VFGDERPLAGRHSTADSIAGFLAALSLLGALLALVWHPGRVGTAAILIALVAAALADANGRLAAWAVGISTACWLAGMTIAVVFDRPIF
jgi:hypothetical protein